VVGIRRLEVKVGAPGLAGVLTLPSESDDRPPVVVMLSGSGPNDKDETVGPNRPFRDIAEGLAKRGIATLRYDKRTRTYPLSVGPTFLATEEYLPDARAAVKLLQARSDVDVSRIFLLGHSLGGTLAPRVATLVPAFIGVILMAASAEPFGQAVVRQLTYLSTLGGVAADQARAALPDAQALAKQLDDPGLRPTDKIASPLAGGGSGAYFLDLRDYDELATARSLRRPILILQGERDYQVTVAENFDKWVGALAGRTDVTTHRYPKANHLFFDGDGPPGPLEYEKVSHVNATVIRDISEWVRELKAD